jgi:rhodanese-related sulfurtransferase
MIQPTSVVIAVRTAGEFKGGKIQGARNLDISSSSFTESVKNLPKDKTRYCTIEETAEVLEPLGLWQTWVLSR